ncbi:MAG TPA: SusC/RagA family TonB-linked outer membrane protein [Gemmatimonadaceae bacterium]|nr:SusC/RagA family TonB-linked outer membrane protein [Gemmatimonadaceae bacterium]
MHLSVRLAGAVRRYFMAALPLLVASPVLAQTGSVAGKVVDRASSQPIADARVFVTGTALEVSTNAQGDYRLPNVRPGRAQIVVLRLGYRAAQDTVTVVAGQNITKNFEMSQSLTTLADVVVTGTAGNQERRAQSAQVATVPTADLVKEIPTVKSVNELLQSRVPGIAVNSGSGTAGANRQIRIRGASSINLSNEPLIFVDGVKFQRNTLSPGVGGQTTDLMNNLNPDEIESIEVVKGPAAATLYGADASAGVIQIITKRGRAGSNSFTQTLQVDVGQSELDWTPPSNYGNCTAALVAANSPNPLCRGQAVGTLVSDNPLVREGAFQKGSETNFAWTGRGGGQAYGYFLSAANQRTLGNVPNNEFERQNVRSNFNFLPDSRLTIDAGVGLSRTVTQLPDNDNNIYGFLGGGLLGSPLTRRDDGVPSQNGWFGFNRAVREITALTNKVSDYRTLGNLTANYVPAAWFTNRFTLGVDLFRTEVQRFFPKNSGQNYAGDLNTGNNTETRIGIDQFTVDYLGNMRKSFFSDELEANLSFGAQLTSNRTDNTFANGQGFVTNANNSINSASTRTGGQQRTFQRSIGYLGQLQLGHLNRRFIQLGLRVDENSSFGAESEPFYLPKIGGSWVVSEEGFYAPLQRLVSQLRLRASWGQTGRSPAPGASLQTYQAAPVALVSGQVVAGAVPLNPGNDTLRPELGEEFEIGLDATFLNERMNLEVTYFDKTSKDVLLQRPLPPSLGFGANPFVNIGEIKNTGFEVALSGQLLRQTNFLWDFRVAGNTLDNELVDLGGVAPFNTLNRFMEGQQLGVWVTKTIRNINEQTGVVTVADTLEPWGNILPTFEGSVQTGMTFFRQFKLQASLDTKQDFYVRNLTDFFRETQLVRSNRRLDPTVLTRRERLRRYGNDTPGQPAFVQQNGGTTTVDEVREAYLQPGDFVRLREVAFSWNVPDRFLRGMRGVSGATLGIGVQNLHIWTDYEGADPELLSAAAIDFSRDDFLTMPNPRRWTLRLNLNF